MGRWGDREMGRENVMGRIGDEEDQTPTLSEVAVVGNGFKPFLFASGILLFPLL
jgi:hypothetical protein